MSQTLKQLFVINDVTDFADNFADITAGQLGFVKNGTVLASNLTAGDKDIQFALKSQTSGVVDTGELYRVTLLAYSAGTAQVSTVDITADAPAGTSKYVKLVDTSLGAQPLPMRTFEGTAAQIAAAINADIEEFADYTASVSGNVITVTAPKNKTFRIIAYSGATIAYSGGSTAAMAPSNGTPEHIAQLEKDTDAYRGIRVTHDFPVVRPASEVQAGATYDVVIADFIKKSPANHLMNGINHEQLSIAFACRIDPEADPVASNAAALITELNKLA